MKNKHILNYRQFINEQMLDPMAAMGADPNAPAPPVKPEKPLHFIFLDKSDLDGYAKKKYPDGSLEVGFPAYSATATDLEKWTKSNIFSDDKNKLTDDLVDLRRKNLLSIVKGEKVNISDDDVPFINKLKNSVSTDIFGRREPEITVLFTKDGIPTTDDVDITFINYKKDA
jgi:hypothetical protein